MILSFSNCFSLTEFDTIEKSPQENLRALLFIVRISAYLQASYAATAQATVAPTMGLLPMPIRPIIST